MKNISREEFESFVSEVENFRETIIDEFVKIKEEMEKLKYMFESLEEDIKNKDLSLGKGQKKLE